ncbi:succinate--hydroxymethylglutarate coa-transferase [Holotrichia oblita]|uniref:Succinate--hydroxymethylglutarate coa-transferase n=1 Tax=Holotrichia oblita TaxID=644536 RepID=A0ACB9THB7_HOLOL|nr:succinate--hydroxymethylglutarate coa-transferase [Holotrichia oblita]
MFAICKNLRANYKGLKIDSAFKSRSINTSVKQDQPPLSGVRIVDLTRIVAGPYCTMILGDMGAEVIKIEKPGSGDEARNWGPPFIGNSGESCYFISLNRNKKSVCVDLKSTAGQQIIYDLVKKSDVFIENYVPGKLADLNLDYDQLKEVAPHLIYCSITGYGSDGPYSKKPGYDVIAASLGGFLHITGPEDGAPVKAGVAVTDLSTGLYAHGAILAALIQRGKTGLGQKIDANLVSTQLATLINIGSNYLNAGKEAKRWGTAHESVVPYEAFPTKDGYFTIGTGSDKQFRDLCKKINLHEIATDPKYLTNALRVENRKELISLLKAALVTKTNSEWTEIFSDATFPCCAINSVGAAFNDRHVKDVGLVEEIEHSTAGKIKLVGPAVKFSSGGNKIRSAPPVLGQHTSNVLENILGYSIDKITKLKEANDAELPTLHLKLRKPKTGRKVQWTTETVDNECMNKKKSKCCCIYKKPKEFGESSSSEDDSDDECDHCKGHVDKKKGQDSTPTDCDEGTIITETHSSNEKSENPPPSDPPPP